MMSTLMGLLAYCFVLSVFTVQQCSSNEEFFMFECQSADLERKVKRGSGLIKSIVLSQFVRLNSGVLRMWFTATSLKFILC